MPLNAAVGSSPVVGDDDLVVSPTGDDDWSGERPFPSPDGTDGPLRTVAAARDRARELRDEAAVDGELTVWLRGGRYPLEEPLTFGPDDAGSVRYAAYPGETPVLEGGVAIEGWEAIDGLPWETVGEAPERVWAADVDGVLLSDGDAEGSGFRQLFVDGERRPRARLPSAGDLAHREKGEFYWIQDVPGFSVDDDVVPGEQEDAFVADPADVRDWHDLEAVDVVVLRRWFEERVGVDDVDPETGRYEIARRGTDWGHLVDEGRDRFARYYLDNVREGLTDPGEWYLDREAGRVYYVPREDERLDGGDAAEAGEAPSFVAPRPGLTQLLEIEGHPDDGDHVEHVTFEGLTFRHAAWEHPPVGARSAQAKFNLAGTLTLEGARHCSFEACTVEHVGQHAIEIAQGCEGVRVVGCHLHDLGGGGVKINGSSPNRVAAARASTPPAERSTGGHTTDEPYPKHEYHTHPSTGHRVTDTHIHDGGRVFHCAVGVLAMHTAETTVAHNHVHDLFYTGVSCGWTWGYEESVERDNTIAHNHIHDLGKGLLSDLGGIYTLGVQPGTTLRGNHVHDLAAWNYGAWPIYPDQASSHLLIEGNVCHDTNRQCFNQHFGRENLVRHNVFAFGEESVVGLYRAEDHTAFTLERNVLVSDGAPIFSGGYACDLAADCFASDLNLLWDVSREEPVAGLPSPNADGPAGDERLSLEEWRERGYDRHSVVADPLFVDVAERDLRLHEDSPAFDRGVERVDLRDAGPRETWER